MCNTYVQTVAISSSVVGLMTCSIYSLERGSYLAEAMVMYRF